jgi:hypothetical protein
VVGQVWECALCGAAYSNAAKHQRFHDELDAWIQLVELEVDSQVRQRLRERVPRYGGAPA